ncbi:MAG: hypothetical protein AB7C90_03320 [Bacteroidales bacterium]
MKTKLFFAALALMAAVSFTMAQDNKTTQRKGNKANTSFVDANNDGICDNAGTAACTMGQGKNQKGKGLRDGSGAQRGKGNGNGMGAGCGNCAAPAKSGQNGKTK